MLDMVLLIFFIVMAARIARTVVRESAIFREFNQSRSLAVAVLLFPLGPIALMALSFRLGWLPAAVAATACYLPALMIARRRIQVFELSGTDRTARAQGAATQAFGAAMVCFIYIAVFLVFMTVGRSV